MDSLLTQMGLVGLSWIVGGIGAVATILASVWAKTWKGLLKKPIIVFNAAYAVVLGILIWAAFTVMPSGWEPSGQSAEMAMLYPIAQGIIGSLLIAVYVGLTFAALFVAEFLNIYAWIPLARIVLARIGIRV